jgi:hypothetical protein
MYYYNMAMTNVPRCSCANVLRSKSFSSVLRLRLWYTRRARVLSMDSLGQGSGLGGSVLRADNLVSCVVIPNELRLELRV